MHKVMKNYTGNIVPEENTIFVFGSNPEGRHGAGSARVAVKQFGAKYGQGEGLQGNAYALPTTELRPEYYYSSFYSMGQEMIIDNIRKMYRCAKENPEKDFKVAYRNAVDERTLCGYTGADLMHMFRKAAYYEDGYPDNVWFSEEWVNSGELTL